MFKLLEWLYGQYTRPPTTLEEEIKKLKAYYEHRRKEISDSTDDEEEDMDNQRVEIGANQIFEMNGRVTALNLSDGRIDDEHYFSLNDAKNLHLHIGCEVTYLARKISDDEPIRIIEIKCIAAESWNDTDFDAGNTLEKLKLSNPLLFKDRERRLNGVIADKIREKIILKLNDYIDEVEINIDHVSTNFQPMKGDEIRALAKVQTDSTKNHYLGAILSFTNITPLNLQRIEGVINKMPDERSKHGIIDDAYIFYANALENADNYERKPVLGDKIIAEAISGTHKFGYREFNWRCIKIIPREASQEEALTAKIGQHVDNDSDGIFVTPSADLITSLHRMDDEALLNIEIRNLTKNVRQLNKIELLDPFSEIKIVSHEKLTITKIDPKQLVKVTLKVCGRFFGMSYERIKFIFDDGAEVIRMIEIHVDCQLKSNRDSDSFYTNEKNFQYTKSVMKHNANVLKGERIRMTPNFIEVKLNAFGVPKSLADIVFSSDIISVVDEELDSVLPSFAVFQPSNYESCFHNLLYLEELQQIHSMRKYDRDQAYFIPEGEFLSLEMPNIQETRPSLIVGDTVRASQPNQKVEYEGVIHRIEKDKLFFKFHNEFHAQYKVTRGDYKLVFRSTRASLVKQHNALKFITKSKILLKHVLFPEKIGDAPLRPQVDVRVNDNGDIQSGNRLLKLFNPALNDVQKSAVVNVLQGRARPLPYVIFGPPGTGKTSAIVEIIQQIYTNVRGSRLLIATPSNSAANLITQRLIDSGALIEGDFVRICGHNALSRGLISESLEPYCALIDIAAVGTGSEEIWNYSDRVKTYNSREIRAQRVLIGTCNALGTLLHLNLPANHFTHVIVDEAGQCMEPEIVIPMSRVSERCGQIILAGDPMQLGPIVLSRLAKARGLDKSFLVRLLEQSPYGRDLDRFPHSNGYDPRLVTKLLYNYRSLPTILSFYSRRFYENELIPTINETESKEVKLLNTLIAENVLKRSATPNHGIYFHAIRGVEEQYSNSPSWCNYAEAKSVIMLTEHLFQAGVELSDIGVITPYQLQSKIIRENLADIFGFGITPKVGSVEEFQGQERMVIVISTVRSSTNEVKNDVKCNAGFVKSARRLNVAVSRARAVVVIYGNPDLLGEDPHWRSLIHECKENGTFIGCERELTQN